MNKTVVAVNEVDFGSTGGIAKLVLSYLKDQGYKTVLATSFLNTVDESKYQISISKFNYLINKILCRFSATDGFHTKAATKRFIKYLKTINPEYLFLNNLHGGYINLPILFEYIKENDIKVIWTLHDCWTFTGKCAHFAYKNCEKWKKECNHCPCLHEHPRAYLFDKSKTLYIKKKTLFESIKKQVTFVCPSDWLNDMAKMSYLKNSNIITIHNGVKNNLEIDDCSSLINLDELKGRKVFFSAGMPLNKTKGLEIINRLADELDNTKYAFICAGIENGEKISKNIINVGCLKSRKQMNYFYNLCDAYLNPTLQETFGLVLVESQFMGTPVISFDTGGCKEAIYPNQTNRIIKYNNYELLKQAVIDFKPAKLSNEIIKKCISTYSVETMIDKYLNLFK